MADIVFYKDLGLDFTPHPVTGDVRPITNETAIKRSLTNLIRTRKGTRPFNPEYGCNISDYLFGYQPGFSEYEMQKIILDSIKNHESRVSVNQVNITFEEHDVIIDVSYVIRNVNQFATLSTTLTRAA
jgi:phage baseplate assembly protein W